MLRAEPEPSHVALAACVNCAGEFTFMADWPSEDAVVAFEAGPAYRAVLVSLEPHLRVAPKRELWRLLG